MMKQAKKSVLLFGSGYMAGEYARVLKKLRARVFIIGRNKQRAELLANKFGYKGYGGGIRSLDQFDLKRFDLVIIACSVESLSAIVFACVKNGTKNILLEKPGALNLNQLKRIKKQSKDVQIHIAYNRRFYGSVAALKEKIRKDGGALGCFFDFTERERAVLNSGKPRAITNRWGFINSSHVIDTAFYLIGSPVEMQCFRSGSWPQHRSGTSFAGSGKTEACLFSYFATWAGGGRWNIEVSTKKGRYRLLPLEELHFCRKNQFGWKPVSFNSDDDRNFKPGLYKMVKSVLERKGSENLPDVNQQIKLCLKINRIFGYEN